MPWPVYSETFLRNLNAGWTTYTVPVGHRVVIKTVSFSNTGGIAGSYGFELAGIWVIYGSFPAAQQTVIHQLMAVAYAGQSFGLYATAGQCSRVASGYLFREHALLRARPPQGEEVPPDPLPPMPPAA